MADDRTTVRRRARNPPDTGNCATVVYDWIAQGMTDDLTMATPEELLERAFGGHDRIITPWMRASRSKTSPLFDRELVAPFVAEPPCW